MNPEGFRARDEQCLSLLSQIQSGGGVEGGIYLCQKASDWFISQLNYLTILIEYNCIVFLNIMTLYQKKRGKYIPRF